MRQRRLRLLLATALLIMLSSCMVTDNPVPTSTLEQLNGMWKQIDGRASVHFYPDETVKLTMPDEQPPIRLLSQLEIVKDDKIGFGVGDRWHGPVYVVLDNDGEALELRFPGEPDESVRSIRFIRK